MCHCNDCKKFTGSEFSSNLVVEESNFKIVSGTPSKVVKTADSGRSFTSWFCKDCGSELYGEGAAFGTDKLIKGGAVDDKSFFSEQIPSIEIFVSRRMPWVPAHPTATQYQRMPGE